MAESCNQAVGVTPTIKMGSVRTFMSKREREENKIKNYKIIFFLNYWPELNTVRKCQYNSRTTKNKRTHKNLAGNGS